MLLRSAKKILRRLRRRKRRNDVDGIQKPYYYHFPPLQLTVRDSDGSFQLIRLRNSLNWHTNARAIVLQMGENTQEIHAASERHGYLGFYEHRRHQTLPRVRTERIEEPRYLLFATLGQLPILSQLAIYGPNPKYASMVRVRDLAVCLRQATHLEELEISDISLVAFDLVEWDFLVESILGLRHLRHVDFFHVALQCLEYSGETTLWDRIFVACSFLPRLESLHITANRYGHLSPASLRALSRAPSLKDVMLIHLHLEPEHIKALAQTQWNELTLFCHWNADMATALAYFIQHSASLETLCLSLETDLSDNIIFNGRQEKRAQSDICTRHKNLSKIVHALAHNTGLRHVRLAGAQVESSLPITWLPLWLNNFVLQSLVIPGLNPDVQRDLDFWVKTLNRAGRWFLRDADKVDTDLWTQLLSHPGIKDDVQALFYLLSFIHPYILDSKSLISSY